MSDRGKKRRLRPGDTSPRQEPQRRENTGDSDAEEQRRLDAPLDAGGEEGPVHRVGEDPPRDAAIDRASDQERAALRLEAAGGAAGEPGATPVSGGDIDEERRRHAGDDAAIAEKRAIGHEVEDAKVRSIVIVSIVGVIVVIAAVLGMVGLVDFFVARAGDGGQPATELGLPSPQPPEPRLQVNPPADWQTLSATEQTLLNQYGWADQKAGTVRLPIDRAMQLLLQRGLPVRPGSNWRFGASQRDLDSSGGQFDSATPAPNGGPRPAGATPGPTAAPAGGGGTP